MGSVIPKNKHIPLFTYLFALLLSSVGMLIAQESAPGQAIITAPDSLAVPDSVKTDTLRKESSIDTIVTYAADSIRFTFEPRVTILRGKAEVRYKSMDLKADNIEVNWDTKHLRAYGTRDSILADSASGRPDSVFWKGNPVMNDGEQVIDGHEMQYDLESKRGRVLKGRTEQADGTYHGETIKKIEDDVYNIRSGFYTTCELDDPHYGFWSRELKMTIKDKVIARPVVLYFDKVPVMIAPFGVFPARSGRHSGLIMPTYGESANQGRYFEHLGYYWAPNDYMDFRQTLDYYEIHGFKLNSDLRYKKRYVYDGSVSGSIVNTRYENVQRGWDAGMKHYHTLSPTMNLSVDAYYQSNSTYKQDYSTNLNDILKRNMRSNATLRKNFDAIESNGSINLGYEESLTTGSSKATVPSINFSRNSKPLFPQGEDADPDDVRWYNQLYWRYGFKGLNQKSVASNAYNVLEEVEDTTVTVTKYDVQPGIYKSGIRHTASLTASQKPMGVFATSQSVSYTEDWADDYIVYEQLEDGTVVSEKREAFAARRTFSANTSVNTTLYGLFHPGILGIEALRHKVSPRLGINFQPDFADPEFGYFQKFQVSGVETAYDKFAGYINGGTPSGRQVALTMGLGNLFEYKRMKGEEEIKGQLFNLDSDTRYNFAADSVRWGDLRSSMSIRPQLGSEGGGFLSRISGLSLTLSGTHSFYQQRLNDLGNYVNVDEFYDRGLRLVDFDVRTGFGISNKPGKKANDDDLFGGTTTIDLDIDEDELDLLADTEDDTTEVDAEEPLFKAALIPWDANFSFGYRENRTNPTNTTKTITSSMRLNMQVTQNWEVSYNTAVDLHRRVVTTSRISLKRDLHCWQGSFNWTPTGAGKGYHLLITLKASHLRDIKIDQRRGNTGFGNF